MFKVEFYRLPSGEKPVETFIDSLSPKMQGKALHSLVLLSEYGNTLREPHSKSLGDGLFEFASDITRIFYFFVVNNRIVLTNGFVKKTMSTPKAELDLARKYKADYERRHSNG